MTRLYGLSEADRSQTQRVINVVDGRRGRNQLLSNEPRHPRRSGTDSSAQIFTTAAGTLPARSGSTAGMANLAEVLIDAATGVLTTSGSGKDVFNLTETIIPSDMYFLAHAVSGGAYVFGPWAIKMLGGYGLHADQRIERCASGEPAWVEGGAVTDWKADDITFEISVTQCGVDRIVHTGTPCP